MAVSRAQIMRFRVKKNLTEICHKVSVLAKEYFQYKKGRFVQDAYIGNWTQQSHLSVEHLTSMRGLNSRFLDLAGNGLLAPGLAQQVACLSPAQRISAANCPYALFDLRFADDGYWRGRLRAIGAWRIADDPKVDADIVDFVRLALFYTWHVASSAGLAAHLLLGMHGNTAEAFRDIAVDALPALALAEAANLTARWSGCRSYWTALISAAARPDPAALRRVQLSGLQLAAAAQLPSEPREV
jgi:hypothetical protein